jgi:hypothetical protein
VLRKERRVVCEEETGEIAVNGRIKLQASFARLATACSKIVCEMNIKMFN